MMVCKNCGNEIRDGVRFCPHCGAVMGGDHPVNLEKPAPYEGPEAPVPGGKKKGLLIGGAIAAVAVAAVLAVALSGLFTNPKGQVEKAAAKTVAAFQAAEEKLGMPDTVQWQKDQTVHQDMSLTLNSVNSQLTGYDLSALSGLGLYLNTDYNGPDRQMYFDLGARWGEDDLVSFQIAADDEKLYVGAPEFLNNTLYGVDTETLGADLTAMTGDSSVKSLSFNLFELVDIVLERYQPETLKADLNKANQHLWQDVEVKKAGAMTLDINGTETKTTAYHAVIPQDVLDRYVDEMTAILSSLSYYDLYAEIFQAAGLPQEEVDEFLKTLKELDVYDELAEDLHEAVEEIGDMELDICLFNGYIAAVLYKDHVYGSDLEATLCLGGGAEYVDDISLTLKADGSSLEITSTGDHGLKNGTLTDKTTFRLREKGSSLAKVTSEMNYAPKNSSGNFQWELGVDSSGLSVFTLEMSGSLAADKDAIDLALNQISLRAMGIELCALSLDYHTDNRPLPLSLGTARMITDMSELELMELMDSVETNAYMWLFQMQQLAASRLPADLLRRLMYNF